jgi:uncharacterized protein (TIGR01244 family)
MKLQKTQLGSTNPVHLCGKVYLAGQPGSQDLKEAKRLGVESVVSLRDPGELPWNEAEAAKEAGLKFLQLPVKSPDALTDEVFDKVREILRDSADHSVLLHCGAAVRVGAVWLAFRVLDQGVPYEQALAEAHTIGLRVPAYEAKAKAYIEARR